MIRNYAFESLLTSSQSASSVGLGELKVMVWLVDRYRDYPWGGNVLNFTFDITMNVQPKRVAWQAYVVCKMMDGWTYIAFRLVEDSSNASIVFLYTLLIENAVVYHIPKVGQ